MILSPLALKIYYGSKCASSLNLIRQSQYLPIIPA